MFLKLVNARSAVTFRTIYKCFKRYVTGDESTDYKKRENTILKDNEMARENCSGLFCK